VAAIVTLAGVMVPDLRPLAVGEIIDVAIKIWRRHLPTLARIVFVVVAPVQILSALVAASVTPSDPGFETVDANGEVTVDTGALAAWLAGMLTAQLLSALAVLIASAAVVRAVSTAYLGGTPEWRESLRAVSGRLGSLIWLACLMAGGLGLAMLALVVPFFWLGVSWSLAFPVLIAEGLRGTGALGRSFRLVQGRWWPTFGALVLAFMLQFFVDLVLHLPLGLLFVLDAESVAGLTVSTIVSIVSSVLTTPFMAAVLVLVYFDLRVRKEGFDLQLLSQGVGIPGTTAPGAQQWTTSAPWPPPGGGWPAPTGPSTAPAPPPSSPPGPPAPPPSSPPGPPERS
jgi:hypothetical protein